MGDGFSHSNPIALFDNKEFSFSIILIVELLFCIKITW